MRIFLDSADLEEIQRAILIDGLTTNPTLLKGKNVDLKELCNLVKGPVSLEVTTEIWQEMITQGQELSRIATNVVVKLPCTEDGLIACRELTKQHIDTNVTLVFTTNQAIMAANCNATYISPFIGRLDDIDMRGMALVKDICEVYKKSNYPTKIIVASVRSGRDVTEAAFHGAHIATVPFKIYKQLFNHPLTDSGLAKFMEDAK